MSESATTPTTEIDNDVSHKRGIRSYVLRQGHMSEAQKAAMAVGLPKWGVDYQQQSVDFNAIFGRDNDKIVEIGFGMGAATAYIAKVLPDKDFIAIDVHAPGVGNLLKLIDEQGLSNVRVLRHDAVEVMNHMVADNSLAGIHVFFPDPWHKKRHHKRRLIQTPLVLQWLPKLKVGAYIHLATDWEEYAEQMLAVLSAIDGLHNTADGYAPTPSYRPETKFEARGKRLGHGVWDIVFTKLK